MKISNLKKIIQEEITKILSESGKYDAALRKFIKLLQQRENTHNKNFPSIYSVKFGKVYDKVIRKINKGEGHSQVYAFINKKTGDIFKPASVRAPAKYSRGNIFNPDPLKGTNVYSVDYLR